MPLSKSRMQFKSEKVIEFVYAIQGTYQVLLIWKTALRNVVSDKVINKSKKYRDIALLE